MFTSTMRSLFSALCFLGAAWLASAAAAQQGDPDKGKVIAYTCNGCHGIPFQQNVYPTYSVPRIGGQNYGYIVSSLQAYREGTRKHATMNAQAHTLSDEDIHDVAAYFVSLAPEDAPSEGAENAAEGSAP